MGASSRSGQAAVQRYSGALLELAEEAGQIDPVAQSLGILRAIWNSNPDLVRLMRAPVAAKEGKANALAAIATAAGAPLSVVQFVQVVAHAGRASALGDMIEAFFVRLAKQRGQIRVTAKTATPLTQDQTARLTAMLKHALGAEPDLDTGTDPSLLGGMTLRIGSRLYDSSLSGQLDHLRRSLLRA